MRAHARTYIHMMNLDFVCKKNISVSVGLYRENDGKTNMWMRRWRRTTWLYSFQNQHEYWMNKAAHRPNIEVRKKQTNYIIHEIVHKKPLHMMPGESVLVICLPGGSSPLKLIWGQSSIPTQYFNLNRDQISDRFCPHTRTGGCWSDFSTQTSDQISSKPKMSIHKLKNSIVSSAVSIFSFEEHR